MSTSSLALLSSKSTHLPQSQSVAKKQVVFKDTVFTQTTENVQDSEPLKDHSLYHTRSATVIKLLQEKLEKHVASLSHVIAALKTVKTLSLASKEGWTQCIEALGEKIRCVEHDLATSNAVDHTGRKLLTAAHQHLRAIPTVPTPAEVQERKHNS